MSVYVYPLSAELTGTALYDNITANDHDYHFMAEKELLERFRAMPQANPAEADMLVVPFMLTQAFTKLRKGFRSPGHAQLMAWNDRVIAAMRSFGPWWDMRQQNHAVFSQRCRGPPFDRLRKASIGVNTWPGLWDSNATMLCFEPATWTSIGRGILIPYGVGHGANGLRCPAGASHPAPPMPEARREAELMFAGSVATNAARQNWVDFRGSHIGPVHTCTHVHGRRRTYMHTYIHACTHVHGRGRTVPRPPTGPAPCTLIEPCTMHCLCCTHTHVRMYACTHVRMYACAHVRMCTPCTLIEPCTMHCLCCTHTHVRMYACTHVHCNALSVLRVLLHLCSTRVHGRMHTYARTHVHMCTHMLVHVACTCSMHM